MRHLSEEGSGKVSLYLALGAITGYFLCQVIYPSTASPIQANKALKPIHTAPTVAQPINETAVKRKNIKAAIVNNINLLLVN